MGGHGWVSFPAAGVLRRRGAGESRAGRAARRRSTRRPGSTSAAAREARSGWKPSRRPPPATDEAAHAAGCERQTRGCPCPRLMVTRGRLRGLGAVVVKGEEGTLHISGRRGPHQRATGGPRGGELPSAVPGRPFPILLPSREGRSSWLPSVRAALAVTTTPASPSCVLLNARQMAYLGAVTRHW